jgi:translation elongation factor P/translation initiation factor 5A
MKSLATDIETFIDDANNNYYFAPNRVIPKKERSKWRLKAKKFYNDLIAAYQAPENRKEAATCMENLYKLFCKATGYYVFVNPEPFEALNISQEDFLEHTLRMKKGVEEP